MRILHVEDNATDADLARRVMADQAPDSKLTRADTLAAARARLESPQDFDLVLLDLQLPDGSGLELLAEIRQRKLPLAVVILTDSGDRDTALAALKAGADDYLKKQNVFQHLATTLQSALANFSQIHASRGRPLHVLYAEHNRADIDLTRRHLVRHAPHVHLTVVEDAAQALERLQVSDQAIDVLLLDFRLPGMDALELTKALRLDRKLDTPIVIVTGQGDEAIAAEALRLGVNDFIIKHEGYLYALPSTLEKAEREHRLQRQQSDLQAATEHLRHLLDASPVVLYALRLQDDGAVATWVSSNIERLLGYTPDQALAPGWWLEHLYAEDRQAAENAIGALRRQGQYVHEYRFVAADGEVRWLRDELRLTESVSGAQTEAIGAWRDITEIKRSELLKQARLSVLDHLQSSITLPELLREIALDLEKLQPDMLVSILLLDADTNTLQTIAAPSLPAEYLAATERVEVREGVGSCGTAAATGKTVIVEDIQTHPDWADARDLVKKVGLHACWSIPFRDEKGRVIGTFAAYHRRPHSPSPWEEALIAEFARLTGLAVQRLRDAARLREAAAIIENTSEGVLITDLDGTIMSVNPAFSRISGYAPEELIGQNPRLLHSGRHDEAFYQALWQSLQETGAWQGEIWNRRKNGEIHPELVTINTVCDEEGQPSRYAEVVTDLSQLRQSQEKLEYLAHHDPLTDLPNRLLLSDRLRHALEEALRHQQPAALLFLDLDRFKQINDSFGHPAGDQLLRAVAERLTHCVRINDTVARVEGDEFVILLEDIKRQENAALVAEKILRSFSEPFNLLGQELYITPSIGIAAYPRDGGDCDTLLRNADTALFLAKDQGGNTFAYYSEELTSHAFEQVILENSLRRAITDDQLRLHYQPLLNLRSGRLIGAEALVRWQHPDLGLVPPNKFIPLAEATGIIIEIGDWVLNTACRQCMAWLDQGLDIGFIAVNVAGPQITRQKIAEQAQRAIEVSGLPAEKLELEVTESFIMEETEQNILLLKELCAMGIRLSIDDFGTGYSSLTRLKRLPIDKLKIDQSFVRDIPGDPEDVAIVNAIIALAQSLDLNLIAEGVETEEQKQFLLEAGCNEGQGYLFARPLPPEEFVEFVASLGQ